MKNFLRVAGITLLTFFLAQQFVVASPKREHRGVWCSALVNDWPGSAISESNADATKRVCDRMLDSLQTNNFTTIYFHARIMCDAMYKSQYEPWSSFASGSRGEAPAFDPLAYIVTAAHQRGLELYAWVNPYRYSNGKYWECCENDYEKTHNDWLLKNDAEIILNPALPEVQQRITDVCKDIITHYDVDGLIFDDYFYNNGGLDENVDSEYYNKYKDDGGTLSQADWRRDNVNTMVRKVNNMIKAEKPWVRFGIGPAGVACTASTSARKYHVKPCPTGGDWQYNQISSDPLAWLSEGTIDFISPQEYFTIGGETDYKALTQWWGYIAKKYNRHLYVSQTLSDFKDKNLEDYLEEIELDRSATDNDETDGTSYFHLYQLYSASKYIDNVRYKFMHYLKNNVYQSKALTPVCNWIASPQPQLPSDLRLNNGELSWSGESNTRYVVYAVPKNIDISQFSQQPEYISAIVYDNKYSIPQSVAQDYNFAVSSYTRYGKESSAVFLNHDVGTAPVVTIVSPHNDECEKGAIVCSWNSEGKSFCINVATDELMQNVIFSKDIADKCICTSDMPMLKTGEVYYIQVISKAVNSVDSYSDIVHFELVPFLVLTPADNDVDILLCPEITWDKITNVEKYTVTISDNADFDNIIYTADVREASLLVPKYTLSLGSKYYVQVEACLRAGSVMTDTYSFSTLNDTPQPPSYLSPLFNGSVMYNDSKVAFVPQEGLVDIMIEISTNPTFPTRLRYIKKLYNFNFEGEEMSKVKISGKALSDGNTYYIRSSGEYRRTDKSNLLRTQYSPEDYYTFIYNANSNVNIVCRNQDEPYISAEGEDKLIVPMAIGKVGMKIYTLDGRLLFSTIFYNGEYMLNTLPKGIYIITLDYNNENKVLKYVR